MSPKLPLLNPRDVIRALSKADFYEHHQTSSHVQLKHRAKSEVRLTIPIHSGDLPKAVLRSIIRQAGLTVEEFLDLL